MSGVENNALSIGNTVCFILFIYLYVCVKSVNSSVSSDINANNAICDSNNGDNLSCDDNIDLIKLPLIVPDINGDKEDVDENISLENDSRTKLFFVETSGRDHLRGYQFFLVNK